GRLVATAGDMVVQTPFAVNREEESYDLTLVHIGQSGQATADYRTLVARIDQPGFVDVFDPDGTATVRLPKGRYAGTSVLFRLEPTGTAMVAQPRLERTGDRVIGLGARVARPVTLAVPKPEAVGFIDVGVSAVTEDTALDISITAF